MKLRPITEKCPFCGELGVQDEDVLIEDVRDSTVLFRCENIHLWGRGI